MSKVKKITVSNLKAVAALTADFNGCTAIITGGNNKGKSSFLRSLPDRLRGLKPDIILKHGEKDGFAEWELTTGEKFIWQFDGKREKLTFVTERNIPMSVTKELSRVYFPPVFDVDEFLNSGPKKQRATLQKLTGIDFTEIEALYQSAYSERTWANRKVEEEKAKLMFLDPDMSEEPVPTIDLEKEINGIDAHNLRYDNVVKEMQAKNVTIGENVSRVAQLRLEIQALEDKNLALQQDITNGEKWKQEEKNKRKENAAELTANLEKVKQQNLLIEENNKARKQQAAYDKAVLNAGVIDKEVKRLEQEKLDVIKNASMPEGFGFSDEGITYNGFAFNKETLSSSDVYKGALKLALPMLGEVRTLHFDASLLDKNSLSEIEKWANDNDLQLLIERPNFDGGEIEYQLLCENGVEKPTE